MADLGSFTDATGVPRPVLGVTLVNPNEDAISLANTEDGELWVTSSEREYNVRCSLSGTQATATTNYYGAIDLSDTVNWPHDSTGRIDISYLSLLVDKAGNARGSVALGVITRIDGTSADIAYVAAASFLQNDTPSIETIANFSPSQLKCGVVGGQLNKVKTNTVSLGVTEVNTGTPLAFGPSGPTFTPAVGDLVLRIITTTGGDLVWGANIFYHSHPEA